VSKKRQAQSVMTVRAGPGPTVECAGRPWRLGFNDQDAKAELEALVVSHATREAVRRKRDIGGPEGVEYFDTFQNRVDAGTYHTFAPGWQHVIGGADGSWLFLLSLLRKHQPHATADDAKRLLAEEPEQTHVAVGQVAPDFFEAVVRQVVTTEADPDALRLAASKLATALLDNMAGKPRTGAQGTG
jgi:hypothetical protein